MKRPISFVDFVLIILLLAIVVFNLVQQQRESQWRYKLPRNCTLMEIDNRAETLSRLRFVCYPKIEAWEVQDNGPKQ